MTAVLTRTYVPAFDRAGQRLIGWLACRYSAERVMAWYRSQGYSVTSLEQVFELPQVVVEERASRLREPWRRWLYGESAAVTAAGPAGIIVGGPVLSLVLLGWSIEMGFTYGLDMTDPLRLDDLRRTIHGQLGRVLGMAGSTHRDGIRWRRLTGAVLFWGFGPEFWAADQVMAGIRRQFRSEWERRALHSRPNEGYSPMDLDHSR